MSTRNNYTRAAITAAKRGQRPTAARLYRKASVNVEPDPKSDAERKFMKIFEASLHAFRPEFAASLKELMLDHI